MRFTEWFNSDRPRDQEIQRKVELLRRDPRFARYDDYQLEKMLLHHSVEEVLVFGPEECMERYNSFSVLDGMDAGFEP